MSKMEAMKENIIRYFDHLFEHKMHDNSHSDYSNVIESLGDYCVERMKEDKEDIKDSKGNFYFVVAGAGMRSVIKDAMDEHLKECHPTLEDNWSKNMRCILHGTQVLHYDGYNLVIFECGCEFHRIIK